MQNNDQGWLVGVLEKALLLVVAVMGLMGAQIRRMQSQQARKTDKPVSLDETFRTMMQPHEDKLAELTRRVDYQFGEVHTDLKLLASRVETLADRLPPQSHG